MSRLGIVEMKIFSAAGLGKIITSSLLSSLSDVTCKNRHVSLNRVSVDTPV